MAARVLVSAFALAAFALPASGYVTTTGQVIVWVDSGAEFTPDVAANFGDQIIWLWASGSHTVTSGGSFTYDGRFRSSTNAAGNAAKQFSWRATAGTGTIPYFCVPHSATATLYVTPAGLTAVGHLRITELEWAASSNHDRVQITNLGDASLALDFFRVTSQSGSSTTIPASINTLNPGAAVTLHLGTSGTSTATDIYLPSAAPLGPAGSFALYVPNNTTAGEGSSIPGSLTDPDQMVDYVEWGAAGQAAQPNQSPALFAGRWVPGDVVVVNTLPSGGAGYSISFCGSAADFGASFWQISTPNFDPNTVRCSTSARRSTWGEIKQLYR